MDFIPYKVNEVFENVFYQIPIEKNNGILLSSDVRKLNIHKQYIKLLCDENYIERIEKGVYVKRWNNN